jgi:hypothetical protein
LAAAVTATAEKTFWKDAPWNMVASGNSSQFCPAARWTVRQAAALLSRRSAALVSRVRTRRNLRVSRSTLYAHMDVITAGAA